MRITKLKLGLIGKDVSRSDSEKIHKFILERMGVSCEYEKISAPISEFDEAVKRLLSEFDGFNVTIPYKRDVMGYLREIVGDASDYGAVNTVVCKSKTGYNTDGVGFLQMLRSSDVVVSGKKVLVLGAGGAGRSTATALKGAGADVALYRRDRELLQLACRELGVETSEDPEKGGYDIVVNATGVGMHESVGKSPVTGRAFSGAKVAVDLIYRPKESEFLRLARETGVKTLNGASMLFYQAYYADCYYLQREAESREADALYAEYVRQSGI